MPVTIGALREATPLETRVSVVPEVAGKLAQSGARVLLERGAGVRAQFPDSAYKSVEWADSPANVLEQADVVLTVQPLTVEQIGLLKPSAVVVGFMQPQARRAVAIACNPATPAPMISACAGRIVPAAVVSIGMNFWRWSAAISTAL